MAETSKNKIDRLHERTLTLVYNGSKNLSFRNLALRDKNFSITNKSFNYLQVKFLKLKRHGT